MLKNSTHLISGIGFQSNFKKYEIANLKNQAILKMGISDSQTLPLSSFPVLL